MTHANAVTYVQSQFSERFATVFLAILDPQTGQFSYANAGHPPSMILRADGRVEQLSTAQFPIGIDGQTEYESADSQLSAGDKLIMYTDGISESRRGRAMYGINGVQDTLQKCADCTPDEILDLMFKSALDACDGELIDDAAVIVIARDK
jgi:serine phosphatase RsbU (regulator of sigma subunit)